MLAVSVMRFIKHLLLKLAFLMSLGISAYGAVTIHTSLKQSLGTPWDWLAAVIVFILIHVVLYVWFIQRFVFRKLIEEQTPVLKVDGKSGSVEYPGEEKRQIPWNAVRRIQLLTTDEGPWSEDVWWLFYLAGVDDPVVVPHGSQGNEKVFDVLEKHFSGANMEAVIKAMGSTSNATFDVWAAGAMRSQPQDF